MIGPVPVYFAYGSNMSGARLRARIGAVQPLGAALLRHWRLAFDKPGRDGTAKANLVACAGSGTWGVAWELDASRWSALDRFELGYRRVRVQVERADGERLVAESYVFEPGPGGGALASLAPSAEYVSLLLAGAREHALPGEYVERIRRLVLSGRAGPGG
jgi:hypothetical protein